MDSYEAPLDISQLCPAGLLCTAMIMINNTLSLTDCLPGYYCNGGESIQCPEGTFRQQPGGTDKGSCQACPPNFWCPKGSVVPLSTALSPTPVQLCMKIESNVCIPGTTSSPLFYSPFFFNRK